MTSPLPTLVGALVLPLGATGCNPECDPASRLDGRYAAWSHSAGDVSTISGKNLDDYPYTAVFFNGWSEWSLAYIAAQRAFELSIDEQPYIANYTEVPGGSCNDFVLDFGGTYVSERGTTHDFEWQGELLYFGTHIGGTFGYSDTWRDPATDDEGSIVVPEGEITANLVTGSEDTRL